MVAPLAGGERQDPAPRDVTTIGGPHTACGGGRGSRGLDGRWGESGFIAFQVRAPAVLKARLIRYAQAIGQSQQSVVTRALQEYLDREEERARPMLLDRLRGRPDPR